MNDELREALYRAFCERSTDGVAEEHVNRIAPIIDAALSAARTEALLAAADQCDKNWQEVNARDARDRDAYDSGAMDAWDIAEQMLRARVAGTQTPAVAGGVE